MFRTFWAISSKYNFSCIIILFLFIYFKIWIRGFPVLSGSLAPYRQHLGLALPFFGAIQIFHAPHCLLQRLFGRLGALHQSDCI